MLRFVFDAFIRLFLLVIGLFPYSFLGIYFEEYATPIYLLIASIVLKLTLDKMNWSLGLNRRQLFYDGLCGILLGGISLVTVYTVVFFIGGHKIVGYQFESKALITWFILCFIGAFGEELFVRGYLYGYLKHNLGVLVSISVSSVIFAILHLARSGFDIIAFFTLFLAGILFAFMREKTGQIWLPFGFHFAWNYISGTLGIWRDKSILFETEISQNALVSGGLYGVEGSVISVLFFLTIIVFICVKNLQTYDRIIQVKR